MPFFDLKVGGVLLRSFVSCRRTSDSVAGMYDIANGVFYPNAGTGTFSIGGDVAPITPITGDTATITSTGDVYKYDGDAWQLWYSIIPPLVFRGITFEQTDFWQIPEMVFRGFSFEITDKVGGASMFHGMS